MADSAVSPDRRPEEGSAAPLADSEALASGSAALRAAMDGIAVYDADLRLLYANPAYCRTYGCEDQQELAETFADHGGWDALVQPGERARLRDEILPTVWRSGRWRGRIRARRPGGNPFEAEMSLARSEDSTLVVVVRDVTEQVRRREALASREQLFRLVAQHSTDLIALHELDGTFVYVSPSVRRLTGFETYEILGELPWELAHPEHEERVRDCFAAAARGESASASYRLKTRMGEYVWFETLAQPVRLSPERPDEVIQIESSSRDIDARKELERQLSHQALHDPLTGLPNRSLFMDRLRQAPGRAARKALLYGVVFLDLDRFKQINDSLGHAVGDQLLVAIAERLAGRVRETDTVARLSGDEFAVLMEELHEPADAEILASRLLEAFGAPVELDEETVPVHPSLGVAVCSGPDEEPDALLKYADTAMYAAKREAGPSYRVYGGERGRSPRDLSADLRRALDEDELRLVFQPEMRLADGLSVGLEALLRWSHREHGSIEAREILAVAQKAGLGPRLTGWVLRRACREAARWARLAPDTGLRLVLNLSTDELSHPGLSELIQEATRRADLPLSRLQVDVRSGGLRHDVETLRALRERGIQVALDDFGRDPISLSVLGRLPVDTLKMDRTLVDTLAEGDGGTGGARAVLGVGRRLGLGVVAEGIETEEQLACLRELGCDRGQGYLLARPMPAEELEAFLAAGPGSTRPAQGGREDGPRTS